MPPPPSSRWLPIGGLALLALVWGTQFLVIKIGQETLPPLLTVALRFSVLAVAAQAIVTGKRARAPAGSGKTRAVFGGLQALSMGLLYWSEGGIDSSVAALCMGTAPFMVAGLAHRLVPGERLTRRVFLALALGLAGIAGLSLDALRGGPEARRSELAAALGAALAAAGVRITAKRLTAATPAPVLLRDMGATVAGTAWLGWLLFEPRAPAQLTLPALAAAVYLGLVASLAATGLYLVLLRRLPVTSLAYLQFVTTLVAVATGTLLGGEALGVGEAIGAAAVLGGAALMVGTTGRARQGEGPVNGS